MGRLKSDFKDLPTAQMRCKIFARIVRMALCHKDDPSKSCANLMDGVIKAELKEFANKLQGTYSDVPKKYLAVMGKGEGSFVSSGRWKNWWDGARPNPKKLEVTSYLLPQTNFWLNPNETIATSFSSFDYKDTLRFKKSEGALHPIYTFLKAVDLWAGEKSCTLEAIKLLLEIQDTWRPKRVVSLSQNSMQKYEWFVSPLSNAEIPSELITDTFCFFEPSSILQTMLWTGDFLGISKTEIYTRWTFDLLSAALATKALIYSKDRESAEVGQTASDLGGKSLDVMSFLLTLFINKRDFYSDSEKIHHLIRIKNKHTTCLLPDTDKFNNLIMVTRSHFINELFLHGIKVDEIKKLDPWLSASKLGVEQDLLKANQH